ncbi:unnamed protein product [Haemonchus placei]|uniref:FERM domain-containing protein n=1 Tax=Haemonchus placei TaxID=6290 RepID=A0A158QR59_HAEPC|nr:unnamed protein product [Haemonchus placei]
MIVFPYLTLHRRRFQFREPFVGDQHLLRLRLEELCHTYLYSFSGAIQQ